MDTPTTPVHVSRIKDLIERIQVIDPVLAIETNDLFYAVEIGGVHRPMEWQGDLDTDDTVGGYLMMGEIYDDESQ